MTSIRGLWASLGFVALVGCASLRPFEAGNDVHALLVAVRADDRRTFETYIDRPTLRANLQAQLVARTRSAHVGRTGTTLGLLLSGPVSHMAEVVLIQPQVLRGVAMYYGYRPGAPIPSPLTIGAALRPTGSGAVCAPVNRKGPCLITFSNQGGVWRLVDIDLGAAERLARRP